MGREGIFSRECRDQGMMLEEDPVGPSESLHASGILFEATIPFRNKGMFSFCYDNSVISE
ncbi:hypothetical protein JHK87_055016 [Glycine soja]|nr:hypothetical protein JHK87_055016 [Glycine soja]